MLANSFETCPMPRISWPNLAEFRPTSVEIDPDDPRCPLSAEHRLNQISGRFRFAFGKCRSTLSPI